MLSVYKFYWKPENQVWILCRKTSAGSFGDMSQYSLWLVKPHHILESFQRKPYYFLVRAPATACMETCRTGHQKLCHCCDLRIRQLYHPTHQKSQRHWPFAVLISELKSRGDHWMAGTPALKGSETHWHWGGGLQDTGQSADLIKEIKKVLGSQKTCRCPLFKCHNKYN